jgi:hypothetical protein
MDSTKLVLDILEPLEQVYDIVCRKPFLTVKVQPAPVPAGSGEVTEPSIAFTIINESAKDMEVRRVWFLTSFNRPIFSDFLDAKMPLKMVVNDRVSYSVPIKGLKSALNTGVGETISKVVVANQTGRQNSGRLSEGIQAAFTK